MTEIHIFDDDGDYLIMEVDPKDAPFILEMENATPGTFAFAIYEEEQ